MIINARNLAAALTSMGADVESALLELASVSPTLDAKVRRALFYHCTAPKLRFVIDRVATGLYFIDIPMSRPICAMHAVDQICQVIDDSSIVHYLQTKFSDYNVEAMIDDA